MGAAVSDIVGVPWAVECKRTTRYSLRRSWIEQARSQSAREGNPWLLVIAEHNDRSPICVMPFVELVELAREAGRIPSTAVEGLPVSDG
jgi:hypothetical protein